MRHCGRVIVGFCVTDIACALIRCRAGGILARRIANSIALVLAAVAKLIAGVAAARGGLNAFAVDAVRFAFRFALADAFVVWRMRRLRMSDII